jgi:hypothetical protein
MLGDPGFAGRLPPGAQLPRRRSIDPGFGQVPQSIGSFIQPHRMQSRLPFGNVPQSIGSFIQPPQQQRLNPQAALANVGNALQQQQGNPGGYPGAPHPLQRGGGQNLALPGVLSPAGMPQTAGTEEPATQMIFKNTAQGPIYYGTPEAEQLTLQGLQRVKRGYGINSPQYRRALNAALGVLGPKYSPDALTAGLATPTSY